MLQHPFQFVDLSQSEQNRLGRPGSEEKGPATPCLV